MSARLEEQLRLVGLAIRAGALADDAAAGLGDRAQAYEVWRWACDRADDLAHRPPDRRT